MRELLIVILPQPFLFWLRCVQNKVSRGPENTSLRIFRLVWFVCVVRFSAGDDADVGYVRQGRMNCFSTPIAGSIVHPSLWAEEDGSIHTPRSGVLLGLCGKDSSAVDKLNLRCNAEENGKRTEVVQKIKGCEKPLSQACERNASFTSAHVTDVVLCKTLRDISSPDF